MAVAVIKQKKKKKTYNLGGILKKSCPETPSLVGCMNREDDPDVLNNKTNYYWLTPSHTRNERKNHTFFDGLPFFGTRSAGTVTVKKPAGGCACPCMIGSTVSFKMFETILNTIRLISTKSASLLN